MREIAATGSGTARTHRVMGATASRPLGAKRADRGNGPTIGSGTVGMPSFQAGERRGD